MIVRNNLFSTVKMYFNYDNSILYTYYVSSSASPEHEGCWSSCCIVGKGRYWEFGGNWRQSLRGHYRVPSAARCSNTSGGPEGSSHSCTISRMLYRGRCPLKHRGKHVKAKLQPVLQQFCWAELLCYFIHSYCQLPIIFINEILIIWLWNCILFLFFFFFCRSGTEMAKRNCAIP